MMARHAGRAPRRQWLGALRALIRMLGATSLVTSCAVLTPLPKPATLDQRHSAFPTEGVPVERPVTVRWNRFQVPYIEAQTDADAAFVLGMTHAHLRLGQMAIVRRIIQGRLSESASIFTVELDAAIRTFDVYRAVDEIYQSLPPETKLWMDRYVAGVNHYAARLPNTWRPHEFDVAGIEWEPWTAQDTLALGRAAGVDLNWTYLLEMLQIGDRELRNRIAARLLDSGQRGAVSYGTAFSHLSPESAIRRFAEFAARNGRSGSNSIAIGSARSATGAPLIANDPHLAFLFPNAWMIVGLRSPSYRAVGMMVPGTPVFGFGRNETLAWGGTNLRATTSQFVDVSGLPAAAFDTEEEKIGVRYWLDSAVRVRRSAYGPVISDLDLAPDSGPDFALRWTGHTPTDETTALLGAMKARTVEEFRQSVAGFAFPPQTFLVADAEGGLAGLIAAKVPARDPAGGYPILVSPEQSDADWRGVFTGPDLPSVTDPAEGYLVSANNRPAPSPARPYGGVFPQDERVRRLRALVLEKEKIAVSDLTAFQQDIVSPLSLELIAALRNDLTGAGTGLAQSEAVNLILGWDGGYRADSRAARVFEALLTRLAPETYAALGEARAYQAYEALGRTRTFLVEDFARLTSAQREQVIGRALDDAGEAASSGETWGDIHRLRIAHVLGQAPLIGGRYLIEDLPAPGSRETVLKSDHPLTSERHDTFFGSQSRHISDLSDLDENYFLLLGGQDGWINSENFADQVALWQRGGFIRMPLRTDSVRNRFPHVLSITPR